MKMAPQNKLCLKFKTSLINSATRTTMLWLMGLAWIGWVVWLFFVVGLFRQCTVTDYENQSVTTGFVRSCTFKERLLSQSNTFDTFVVIIAGSVAYFMTFLFLCIYFFRYSDKKAKNKNIELTSVNVDTDYSLKVKQLKDSPLTQEVSTEFMEQLLHDTWKYENRHGIDSHNLSHKGIKVKSVLKVQNNRINETYEKQKQNSSKYELPKTLKDSPIMTTVHKMNSTNAETSENQSLLSSSNLGENEVYLFHGTKLENIANIIENGLDLKKASKRSLYGRAIYFAESSEKADQYADRSTDRRKTDLAMIVARVIHGKIHIHEDESAVRNPKKGAFGMGKPQYDMVIAGVNKRFREFLIFDKRRCCPEFIVIYDREG